MLVAGSFSIVVLVRSSVLGREGSMLQSNLWSNCTGRALSARSDYFGGGI